MKEFVKTYKDLTVWKKSYNLTLEIYKITKLFPKEETYSLISQMRRAAISVVSNIVEGFCRQHTQEYIQFLHHSYSSLAELETQLLLSKDLGYVKEVDLPLLEYINEIERMLFKLIQVLKQKTKHSVT